MTKGDEEISRKRKSSGSGSSSSSSSHYQKTKRVCRNVDGNENGEGDDSDYDFLALRLRTISEKELSSLSSLPPLSETRSLTVPRQQHGDIHLPNTFMHESLPVYRLPDGPVGGVGGGGGGEVSRPLRRNPTQTPGRGKSETVPALFPWATTSRATVYPLNHLLSRHITAVQGVLQCKKCDKQWEVEYDLKDKFLEVAIFIAENKTRMHDRAPSVWMNPPLPACRHCGQENSAKPVIADKKKQINWLFLLLGQFLGCCSLQQLKYFCKHTKNHRTGAKDRLLYLTYLGLCKQLDPSGPFDR